MTQATTSDGRRVLIVEDETLIAEEIHDRLVKLGFQVVGMVDTGDKAIAAAQHHHPDLILMDIRLKGTMDGIEAAEQIRKRQSVPVVFLTAHSDQATLQRAKGAAPFGYVLKPFHERELLVALEMAANRHLLESRLKASEQKYATTLASIGDGVIGTDALGQVNFMNPVAEALTQWSFGEAAGKSIQEVLPLISEATHALIENPALEALRRKTRVTISDPVLLVTRDSAKLPVDDCAAPILDERGQVCGAVLVFRDIRQRRLTEDALRQAEDQLRQAHKMEAIGRLAGGVAHDFNNLLTVINCYVDMLLKAEQPDSTSAILREIRKAGERATTLTQQLLVFSRKKAVQPTVVNLNALVTETGALLRRLIGEDIKLSVHLSPDLRALRADASQLEQVIMNLAANARDAMPRGGTLSIETSNVEVTEDMVANRPEALAGDYVRLLVKDSGCGMDKATRDHLFEPFFTTKPVGKGTGLGLSTVYGIVGQANGFIDVVSEPGRGCAFALYFPAIDDAPSPLPPSATTSSLRGKETILLVEDEASVRFLTATALKLHGYQVLEADGGASALQIVKDHAGAIDLVIADVVMPGMSGLQVAEKLQTMRPSTRVLYLSGHTEEAMQRHGVRPKEVDFLSKPFTLALFTKKVREVLDA